MSYLRIRLACEIVIRMTCLYCNGAGPWGLNKIYELQSNFICAKSVAIERIKEKGVLDPRPCAANHSPDGALAASLPSE